ncbi:carbohydrate ABC transporter permease [Halorussus caseinilyticus]|uniref:carbohydrate ABC transporter permease n=1 Tax=Halorussus caseinilyticus TaxID=3034025 RepID=UPI0023E7D662|nr:sugar ABC transporter permease [Halorussus sp. DT72]
MATEHPTDGTDRESRRSGPYVRAIRWMENLGETSFAYLLLSPALLVLAVIAFWPLLRTFELSLHADQLVGTGTVGEFVGLTNYVELLTGQRAALLVRPLLPTVVWSGDFPFVHGIKEPFHAALTVTFIFTIVSVFFETLIGLGQALVLDQDFRGRRWVRVAIILPWAVPIVIQGMIFYLLFQPNIGFLVEPLQTLGVFTSTPLSNSVDSMIILVFADVWKTSAFMALLILAGLQSIDRNLYEVARVSGATRWQQFKMITLPLILPTVMVAMLFRTIGALRIYGLIETVTSCSTVPSLSCLVVSSFSSRQYGTAAAIAFITAAIIAVAVSVYIAKFADTQGGGF